MKIQKYSHSLISAAAIVAMVFCPSSAPAQNAPEIEAFIAGIDGYDGYDDPVITRPDFSGGRELPRNVLPESATNDFSAPASPPERVDAPKSAAAASDAQPAAGSEEFVSDYFDDNYYVDPAPLPARTWVLGVTVPIFRREFDGNRLFSFNPADTTQTLSSNDADPEAVSGIDINFARRSSTGLGVEARYWGLFSSSATAVLGGTPTTAINGLSQLNDNGVTLSDTFNTADFHALTREYSFNNAEFNILKNGRTYSPFGRRLSFERLAGFRFLQFDESLEFAGVSSTNATIRSALNSSVQNSLFGFQVGRRAEWQVWDRAAFTLGGKLGLFNNRAQTNIVSANQQADLTFTRPVISSGPNTNAEFEFGDSKDDLSLLGEFEFGMVYQMTRRTRLRFGYRVLGVSDIADSEKNIPADFTDTTELLSANTDGDLVLRGGYIGAEIAF